MSVDALYQEIILDHYRNPRHKGLREPFTTEAHHVNPTCGDEVTLRVRLSGSGDSATVEDVSYAGEGCSISQASTSVLSELVTGRTVAEGMQAADSFLALLQGGTAAEADEDVLGDGVAFAGVARYPARVKCALLGWMAWKDATARAVAHESTNDEQEAVR
ncbi:Fe-S cluster assembly sulfur transfer protein SufU [Motilibacter aurantiacus]|uniref:Fe-S cluster assembly sulfur transfer protein SufU n=1 Tax=Motilibacter aurantiacus TaxID=2714955 RepID=UPI00140B957C|nr:SUF system NifU family Fe-S cluster assembly protein [Motilibacter aurantiacus]